MRQETARPRARSILSAPSILSTPAAAALYAIATLFFALAAVRAVVGTHADRRDLATGAAEWIWSPGAPAAERPLRFFAARGFVLDAAPSRATAKVFVDREHVLFVNGVEAGRGTQAPGDPLRIYRIAPLLAAGANRILIEASSPTGSGGILFSLDLDGFGRDAVVSDRLWRVGASAEALATGGGDRPMVWGRPPQHPWGYPRLPGPAESPL